MNKTGTDEQEIGVSGLLKYKEVAERLSISENQVCLLKATGKLPYVQIGRSIRRQRRLSGVRWTPTSNHCKIIANGIAKPK